MLCLTDEAERRLSKDRPVHCPAFPRSLFSTVRHRAFMLMMLVWGMVSCAAWGVAQEPRLSWAEKMFSARQHNFGTVGRSQDVEYSIDITNLYKETVNISEVTSSCACISPSIENRTLQSKETTKLRLKLDTDRFSYQRSVTVKVRMNFQGGSERVVLIPISAFIDPNRPAMVAPQPATQEAPQPKLTWADKMFSNLNHDFGGVARGAEVRHSIQITNSNVETVTITDVQSSCLCVRPEVVKRSIASRETTTLDLELDTLAFYGKRDATITVTMTFDNSNFTEVRIPVKAYIRRDVVIQPSSVEFGMVTPRETATQKIQINYAGRESWTIREVRVPNPLISTELNLLRRSGGFVDYELVVKLNAGVTEEGLQEQLVLVTDDANNTHIPLIVRGQVATEFQITPEVVKLGSMQVGVETKVSFAVKGRKPFLIEKVESDSNRECFKVNLPPAERPIHVVNMTVTPPDQPGPFEEGFTLTIAGRSAPLTFRAVGTIEAPAGTPAPEEKPENSPAVEGTPAPTDGPPTVPEKPVGDVPATESKPDEPATEAPAVDTPAVEPPPALEEVPAEPASPAVE